jgi:hypothetical protein
MWFRSSEKCVAAVAAAATAAAAAATLTEPYYVPNIPAWSWTIKATIIL